MARDVAYSLSDSIVSEIVKDLSDRRGLRQTWEGIDEEIRKSIEKEWRSIVRKHFALLRRRWESEQE